MTREESCAKRYEAIPHFTFEGTLIDAEPYGSGHINDTFLVRTRLADESVRLYILQRMNHEIFKNPDHLMANISNVTAFLRRKIEAAGGDPNRETLTVVPTTDNRSYYKDEYGSNWRAYYFITDAITYDRVEKPEHFYKSAEAFGNFQRLLADYPADTLYETIPNFHNTPVRYANLERAIAADICGRAKSVQAEIAFAVERKDFTKILMDKLAAKEIPLRVTHNDTKLNNIMLDTATGNAICVIDLDTVMPGFAMNDFGDSIRFGANTGAEDETNLDLISCDLELFRLYTRGFLKGCAGSLTEMELRMLPTAAKMMTLECGMRFLTDYLEGDTYFKIHRENHNLDRCRTQFKLVADMEAKWEQLEQIVKEESANALS